MMVTVGITGGIGSGKSTVCSIWAALGAKILNADDLAKELMATDSEIQKKLVSVFGEKSFLNDGSLNRDYLAKEAFEKGRVQELNAIVHPKIPAAVEKKMKTAEEEEAAVFVYEAALLLDNLEPGELDYTVLVLANKQQRIERVHQRDNSSISKIQQRIDKQRNFEKAADHVDFVIRNSGSRQELKKKAEDIYENFYL